MRPLRNSNKFKTEWFSGLTILLVGLWIFLIPINAGARVPVAILALQGLITLVRQRRTLFASREHRRYALLIGLYALPVLLSMTDAVALKYPIRILCMSGLSLLAGIQLIEVCKDNNARRWIGILLAAGVGFWVLDALIQAVAGRDLFWIPRHRNRLGGPFTSHTRMGYYLGPFSALLFFWMIQHKWKWWAQLPIYIATTIVIVLNNCRGGWIMFAVVSAIYLSQLIGRVPRRYKGLLVCLGIALAVSTAVLTYHFSESVRKRVNQTLLVLEGNPKALKKATSGRNGVWSASWGIIQDHPINGIGARNFRYIAQDYWHEKLVSDSYPHQVVLEYAVGTGLIGVVGLFASMALCIRWFRGASPRERKHALALAVLLAAEFFPLNTHRAHYSSGLALNLWIIIALFIGSLKKQQGAEISSTR